MKQFFGFVMCLVAIHFSSCHQPNTYHLAYRFQPGQVYEIYSHTTSVVHQETMGTKVNSETIQQIWIDWEILGVNNDSVYDVQSTYKRIIANINTNDSSIRFDSNMPIQNIESANIPQLFMVGKAIDLRVAKNGAIKEVNGVEELINEILENDISNNPSLSLMLNNFTGESMKSFFAQYQIFPEKAVKIGESWKNKFVVDMVISFETDNEYKLESIQDNEARIVLKGVVKSTKSKGKGITGILSSMMEIEGATEGYFVVNLHTGEIKDSECVTEMQASVNLFGVKMPMNLKNKTLYKIIRKSV